MESIHQHNKTLVARFRRALYDCDAKALPDQLAAVFAPDAVIHLAQPLETLAGVDGLYEHAYAPLLCAIPDLERRDFIVIAGESRGENWVGCAGYYTGVFEYPWLDIPPTQHMIAMRYHEFFRIDDDYIVEMQALWDIPQVMIQAGAWPMMPSLGVEWVIPGPATQDGIITEPYDAERSEASLRLVGDMLTGLKNSPQGVEAMQLDRYWHPKMIWYGPAGIGGMRRISGFRNWHQIPFLNGMPDRGGIPNVGAFFADGDYVGFTAFPGMRMTITGDGWLGIAPANQAITMRSLDFWRCENGLIRENWVLVDLLHVYKQIGINVFARMRELTYGRRHQGTGHLQK
jgi:predicted ester cyclase